ncbi:MAG: spore coat associated protein CotJA [Eubacteriales bacterium]
MPGMPTPTLPGPPAPDPLQGRPLAMVYVPRQVWRDLFPLQEALALGSLFRELYMPIETADGTGRQLS